jgi:hypothetical protein
MSPKCAKNQIQDFYRRVELRCHWWEVDLGQYHRSLVTRRHAFPMNNQQQHLRRLVRSSLAWRHFILGCLFGAACWNSAGTLRGQTTNLYDAGAGGFVADPVFDWGWTPHNIAPVTGAPNQGVAVTNDLGTGLNAWNIDDNKASTANPFYSDCIDAPGANGACGVAQNSAAALQNGWRFSTRARYLSDHDTNIANMGLSAWLSNLGYFVQFDLNNNDLRATLYNAQHLATTLLLTTGGTGAAAYHDMALVYSPVSQKVAFEFDGVTKGFTTGFSQTHENAVLWGNLASADGRGTMNFHDVEFQVLLPGDFNRNGFVDAADYTMWRDHLGSTAFLSADGNGSGVVDSADYSVWKSHFGTNNVSGAGAAASPAVPEPSGFVAILGAAVGLLAMFRGRAASPLS